MVQVVKKVKIDGEIHEIVMALSDIEWKLLQKHYPSANVSFELIGAKKVTQNPEKKIDAIPGRDADDDKPGMSDYNLLKDKAMEYFKEENWDKSLYYFEEAYKLKGFGWIRGKISACKKNAKLDKITKPKV